MNIIEFYKNILKDVDVDVDQDGYLEVNVNGNKIPITRKKGKRLILPTKEVINNFYTEVEGEMIPKGLLFNPLKEIISMENIGADVYRDQMSIKLSTMILAFGNNIILCLSNPESQTDLGMVLNNSFANLRKNVPGMKLEKNKVGDEAMIKAWEKMINNVLSDPEDELVRILTTNDKNRKYTKIGKLVIPIFEDIVKSDPEEKVKVGKTTLRPKDRVVFEEIFKLLFPDINEKGVVQEYTTSVEVPVMTTLLNMFYNVARRYHSLMDAVKHLDTEAANSCVIHNTFSKEFIDGVGKKYASELSFLPTENEVNNIQKVLDVKTNKNETSKTLEIRTEKKLEPYSEETINLDPVRALRLNEMRYNGGYGQPMYQQPVMQQPMMGQPMMNYQQPVMNYQQHAVPQFQQPMNQGMRSIGNTSYQSKVEAPDDFELRPQGKMVSVLNPERNLPQNYGVPYGAQNVFQQPQMYGNINMQQPMMGQPMMNYQQPMMGYQQPMAPMPGWTMNR